MAAGVCFGSWECCTAFCGFFCYRSGLGEALSRAGAPANRTTALHLLSGTYSRFRAVERSVDEKIAKVTSQLAAGEARIVFDPQTETANIVLARDMPKD